MTAGVVIASGSDIGDTTQRQWYHHQQLQEQQPTADPFSVQQQQYNAVEQACERSSQHADASGDGGSSGSSQQHPLEEPSSPVRYPSLDMAWAEPWIPDHTFKLLLVGDSGVGKTCLLTRFTSNTFQDKMNATVGVDFASKRMLVNDTKVKVMLWDTAGQERFRTLTSTFYRGAKGIVMVYDVTRPDTLADLESSWLPELEQYEPHPQVARMVVANKVDQADRRRVAWQEGADFARRHGCLFVETSAKQNIAVGVAFEELVLRILETPELVEAADEEEESLAAAVALGGGAGTGPSLGWGASSCTGSCF